MSIRRFVGVCIGLVGVMVLVGWDALAGLGATVLSQLAIVGAALSYACTNILARRAVTGSSGSASAAALICALVWALPLSAGFDQPWGPRAVSQLHDRHCRAGGGEHNTRLYRLFPVGPNCRRDVRVIR